MKRIVPLLIALILFGVASATADKKVVEIWIPFHDEPTAIFPHEKDYRVFFAHHAGVYYLQGSDPTLKQDLALIQQAIKEHQTLTAETEATYLYLRKIK